MRYWTTKEIEFIRNSDLPVNEMARALGRTPSSVRSKRCADGITKGRWTEEEDETLKELRSRNYSARYIANQIGRSARAVQNRLRRLHAKH